MKKLIQTIRKYFKKEHAFLNLKDGISFTGKHIWIDANPKYDVIEILIKKHTLSDTYQRITMSTTYWNTQMI